MKAAIGVLTCAIALVSIPQTVHAGIQATATQADQSLNTAITDRLTKDSALKNFDIKVSVNAGVATLTGTVKTDMQRNRAAEVAESAGARSVENRIVVNAAAAAKGTSGTLEDTADTAADKTKDAASKTKDAAGETWEATKEGAAKTADRTEDVAERAWEKTKDGWEVIVDRTAEIAKRAGAEITDAYITTSIKTRMVGEDALEGAHIDVDTDRHVVTLSGTVPSEAGRERAVEIAKKTDGVDRIVDKLTVAAMK